MIEIFLIIIACLLSYVYVYYQNWDFYRAGEKFPGPRPLPILGNSLNFATTSKGIFEKITGYSRTYGRLFRVWNNGKLYVISSDYKDIEVVLGSNVHLHKTDSYKFFQPWIGEGLISSSDINYWRKHRKIITPTFHFKILHGFLDVFNRNSETLCETLASKVGKGVFNVHHYVKLAALDNICETAMGVNVNAQRNSESAYVKAVEDMVNVVILRFFKVWLMNDFLFSLSKYARIQKKALRTIHETTEKLIRDKREEFSHAHQNQNGNSNESFNEKKKLAFLDLLINSEEGSRLSDKEIREEVSTFLFAGHDTISSGISFAMYCLGQYPEIQELVYKEQVSIFDDSFRPSTYADIQEMKYLERVLKEVQRVYPSVPFIGRELFEDLQLPGNCIVPKGTQFCMDIFSLHRSPKVWQNPEKFDPDNFLPEAVQSRSPYAYVPFSAGPRNCIGQKYAMLAMKATISSVVRRYKILPSPRPEDKVMLAAEIVLISTNGCNIQIESR